MTSSYYIVHTDSHFYFVHQTIQNLKDICFSWLLLDNRLFCPALKSIKFKSIQMTFQRIISHLPGIGINIRTRPPHSPTGLHWKSSHTSTTSSICWEEIPSCSLHWLLSTWLVSPGRSLNMASCLGKQFIDNGNGASHSLTCTDYWADGTVNRGRRHRLIFYFF